MPSDKLRRVKAKKRQEVKDGTQFKTSQLSSQLSITQLDKENCKTVHLKTPKQFCSDDNDSQLEWGELPMEYGPGIRGLNERGMHAGNTDHSTPTVELSRPVDDGCFGFDSLSTSLLPFSPVGAPRYPCGPRSFNKSPRKRKKVVAVYDIPIDDPKRKPVKKPAKKAKKKETNKKSKADEDWVRQVNEEFSEIAKFELEVE